MATALLMASLFWLGYQAAQTGIAANKFRKALKK